MTNPSEADASGTRRPRILFVAEAVTLAHIARPVTLARGLDPARYEVILASAPRYRALWDDSQLNVRPIHSIPSECFLNALAQGQPVYSVETLRAYVKEDLDLLQETRPDIVVGDFRLSLAVSARVAGIPYLTITNAYWSPYARLPIPMPELPLTRRFGVQVAQVLFQIARPLAFALHALPLNRVLREYGLPSLGPDLRKTYTEADHILYADIPELVPTSDLPSNHHYVGPIGWSPKVELPDWWHELPEDRPSIYVTLGSSGRADLMPQTLDALSHLPVAIMVATAGRVDPGQLPENAWVADFLPGDAAVNRTSLVICNGGSPTTYQALTAGKPVLGLAGNMDQHLNMFSIKRWGAGELLRSDTLNSSTIRETVASMLARPSYAESASRLAGEFAKHNAISIFNKLILKILSKQDFGSRTQF